MKYMNLPTRVGLVFTDADRNYFQTEALFQTEKKAFDEAKRIASYIHKLNIKTYLYPANRKLIPSLLRDKPEVVLNLVGAVRGIDHLAATIPATLELLEIPYSGADLLGESFGYNKYMVKKLLQSAHITVPNCQLFYSPSDSINTDLSYPVIVKLNEIHGSVEINQDSVCQNETKLRQRLHYLFSKYHQTMLVEEFIIGDEFSAIGYENETVHIYIAKNKFGDGKNKNAFASFDTQWGEEEVGFKTYKNEKLTNVLKRAYSITRMRDYGKFDIRQDNKGFFYILDSNTNPAFGPKENDCAISTVLDLYGISFEDLLKNVLSRTFKRQLLQTPLSPRNSSV